MNRDHIIRMALEAGFVVDEVSKAHQPNCIFHTNYMVDELLERFAALVAAAEREACAKVCEEFAADANSRMQIYGEAAAAAKCAAAIRNRGQA